MFDHIEYFDEARVVWKSRLEQALPAGFRGGVGGIRSPSQPYVLMLYCDGTLGPFHATITRDVHLLDPNVRQQIELKLMQMIDELAAFVRKGVEGVSGDGTHHKANQDGGAGLVESVQGPAGGVGGEGRQ